MALTEAELKLIEKGISLAVSAVLAAIRAAGDQGPMDWNSLRITVTPEMALEKAQKIKNLTTENAESTEKK